MNNYTREQIKQMGIYIETFIKGCEIAAISDDGKKSKEEEKEITKIRKVSEKYKKELEKIIK